MKNKDHSLSTDQCLDAFEQALGIFLHSLVGHSDDTLPSGLPTPVKSINPAQEKGNKSDKSNKPR